jgi:hypothetical protein
MTSPDRFPLAAAAVAALRVRSCLIDGGAIICDANGLAVFDLPIEDRKRALANLLRRQRYGVAFNEQLRQRWHGGDVILCAFDLLECLRARLRGHCVEAAGIPVPLRARRLLAEGSRPCSVKNPAAPVVTREAEEEWYETTDSTKPLDCILDFPSTECGRFGHPI